MNRNENQRFSVVKKAKSITHAWRGIVVLVKTTSNSWIQAFILVVAIVGGLYFKISAVEWLFLILGAGFAISIEAVNTAFEIDIDLTSPDFHPFARDTKDVAAGAALIADITAFLIGAIIFLPRIYHLLVALRIL